MLANLEVYAPLAQPWQMRINMGLCGSPLVHARQVAIAHANGRVKARIRTVQHLKHKPYAVAPANIGRGVGECACNLVKCGGVGPVHVGLRPVAACVCPRVTVNTGFDHKVAFQIVKPCVVLGGFKINLFLVRLCFFRRGFFQHQRASGITGGYFFLRQSGQRRQLHGQPHAYRQRTAKKHSFLAPQIRTKRSGKAGE